MAKFVLAFLALLAIQYASAAPISFKWCSLPSEWAKCTEFMEFVNKTAIGLQLPAVTTGCVNASTSDDCITAIKKNQADLVTLDGGRVYTAGKESALIPIVSEQYGQYGVKYYAVAVVMRNNTGFNLKTLKGKKSCHTGLRRTAGWNVPIGYLLRTKIMEAVACGNADNDLMSTSKFFSKSCVPGVDKSKYDNLCELCAGSGADKCSKDSSKNKYVSYHGAFKCMGDGVGDVAFVKHTTTQEVVGKGGYGNVTNYQYLCQDGSRKDIGQHETCHLGFNAAHAVVTREGNTDIANIIKILKKMSELYGDKQTDWRKFQLFNSTAYGGSNLIFKDSTTELKGIETDKQTYMGFLGDDYVKDLEALKSCAGILPTTTAPPPAPTAAATVTSPITGLVLLIALFSILFL